MPVLSLSARHGQSLYQDLHLAQPLAKSFVRSECAQGETPSIRVPVLLLFRATASVHTQRWALKSRVELKTRRKLHCTFIAHAMFIVWRC